MSDTYSEDDRKPAAVKYREPRDLEKGEGSGGGVNLPVSATTQSKSAQSSSSRHKHSHEQKQHHRDKSSRNNHTIHVGDNEKIAATDSRRAPHASKASNRPTEFVSLADDMKPPYKSTRTPHHMEEVDNESIAKPRETLSYAPSLVARRHADSTVQKVPYENVDKELPAAAFGQFNLPGQPTTTIAFAANENVAISNRGTTNAIMTPQDTTMAIDMIQTTKTEMCNNSADKGAVEERVSRADDKNGGTTHLSRNPDEIKKQRHIHRTDKKGKSCSLHFTSLSIVHNQLLNLFLERHHHRHHRTRNSRHSATKETWRIDGRKYGANLNSKGNVQF
jgi:hypothetical protein